MRIIAFLTVFVLFGCAVNAQSAEDEVIRIKGSASSEAQTEPVEPDSGDKPGGSWDINVGTSFSYSRGFGSGMMFYTAPAYTLPLTDRWSLHGGVMVGRFSSLNMGSGEEYIPPAFTSLAMFAAASYRLNERLILHGSGVRHLINTPVSPYMPYPVDNLSLGATFKLGDNISIGATIHMNNGAGFYGNPHMGAPFHTPFFW